MADREHAVSAGQLACQVDGPAHAPVLVLLHALATHSEIWRPQLAAWSTAFRVVRIDLPGHGASPPPAGTMELAAYAAQVGHVLDALAIERATLVGLSLGGMVAQAMALQQPQRVQALVLAHTSARTEPAVREVWQRRLEQFERHGLQQQVEPTLERWFTRTFAAACPLTMGWVAAQIRTTSADGYATAVRAIQALDHLDRLAEIRAPALVIAGDCDAAVPPPMAAALAARLRRAELLVIDDAGHLGNVQQPLRFTEAVGRFVQQAVNAPD
jgi:3-oxoadipate enol-lactonase